MELCLKLIPASDQDFFYLQSEFAGFEQDMRSRNLEIIAEREGIGYLGHGYLSGKFIVKLVAIVGPVLGTGIGAWLHARSGRKVRLKIGDIEAEARTVEEVEKLLDRAKDIQQRNEPKMIHEP